MGIWDREADVFDTLPMALMHGYKGDSGEGGGINSLSKLGGNPLEAMRQNALSGEARTQKNTVVVFKDCTFKNCHFHFGDR